jgi:hypothetical protein
MKKSLLALSLTALLFSCKKETTTDFTATDVTGTTTVKGTCTKNIITPNGFGGWQNNSRVPAAGVLVQIKVNKNNLYPNSIAQGADVYSATTDANGNWSMNVKSNATGVTAYMTIAGFNSTLDTLINGVTKTGLYANYFGTTSSFNCFMGTTFEWGTYGFNASNLSSNPNNIMIGSASISGSVSANHILSTTTGTNPAVISTTNMAVPAGITVYMSIDKDPTLLATKNYTTTTDANGRYSFNFPTVASGTSGFNQNATIWVADYATTRDTVRVVNGNNAPTITGRAGVFGNVSTNQNGVYNNEIRNATNMNYNSFTQN